MLAASVILSATLAVTACAPGAPTGTLSPTPEGPASAGPIEVDTTTIRTIIDSPVATPALTVIGPARPLAGETAEAVEYTSAGLTITGVVRTPAGDGPHPAVVVVHGASDPETYDSGRDLAFEQRALLAAGYVVFATDLRGWGGSDAADAADTATVDPGFGWDTVLDWGMALDVVNALRLVRSGAVADVDTDRVGLLGHSLGGLLAQDAAVIAPGLSDLVVALSAPSSDFAAIFDLMSEEQRRGLEESLGAAGTPSSNPQYWADISPRTFFDRVTEPIVLIHGSADDTTLPQWSQQTAEIWQTTGNDASVYIVEGGDHLFKPHEDEAAAATVAAFDAVIGQAR